MKVIFLANNLKWDVRPYLRRVEQEFAKCGITINIVLKKTALPIVWDTTWGAAVYTSYPWFNATITPYGKGYSVVALGVDAKEWLPKTAGGWHKAPYNGVHGIEVDTRSKLTKVKCGKNWLVYVLCHELCHVLFAGKPVDETHNYVYVDNKKWQLKECLSKLI